MTAGGDAARRAELKREWKARQTSQFWQEIGLTPNELNNLHAFLEANLAHVENCDRTLKFSLAWAALRSLDRLQFENNLIGLGGGCDCEVIANVDPSP